MVGRSPVHVRWTFDAETVERCGIDDLPWDNGTDRVVVDGLHVTEVRWTEIRVRLNEDLMDEGDDDFLAFLARMIMDTPWQATWVAGGAVLNRIPDGTIIGTFDVVG